jgi:hypothetical protein
MFVMREKRCSGSHSAGSAIRGRKGGTGGVGPKICERQPNRYGAERRPCQSSLGAGVYPYPMNRLPFPEPLEAITIRWIQLITNVYFIQLITNVHFRLKRRASDACPNS